MLRNHATCFINSEYVPSKASADLTNTFVVRMGKFDFLSNLIGPMAFVLI